MKAKAWKERYIRVLVLKGFTIKKATDFFNSVEDIDVAYPYPEEVAMADFEDYCEEETKKHQMDEYWVRALEKKPRNTLSPTIFFKDREGNPIEGIVSLEVREY